MTAKPTTDRKRTQPGHRALPGITLGIALFALCVTPGAFALGWPEIEAPPKSTLEWVGKDMKLNGVPLRIQRFESSLSPDEVLTFYRVHWGSQQEKKSVENKQGSYSVIGKRDGDYYLTVEVKAGTTSASEGLLNVSRLPSVGKPDMSPGDLPMNSGSKVLWVMDSNDAGKTSKQVTLFNRDSVQSNASYYDNALQSRGWVKRQDTKAKDSPDENNLLSYAKDGAELTLEIVHKRDSQATLVVSNLVGSH
jgi:hypothetical protein